MSRPPELHPAVARAIEGYRKIFAERPRCWVKVPLGATLMGSRAGDCDGLTMGVGLDPSMAMAVSPRQDGMADWTCLTDRNRVQRRIDALKAEETPGWAWVMSVALEELRRRGYRVSGFNAVLAPADAEPPHPGRSGSLLLLTTLLAARELFPFACSDEPKAPPERDATGLIRPLNLSERIWLGRFCHRIHDDRLVSGAGTGLAAAMAVLARPGTLVELDCQSWSAEFHSAPEYAWYLSEGESDASDAGMVAPLFPHSLRQISRRFGVRGLRSLELHQVQDPSSPLSDTERDQATHLIEEIRRVVALGRSLSAGDGSSLGPLLAMNEMGRASTYEGLDNRIGMRASVARRIDGCLASIPVEDSPPKRMIHLAETSCSGFSGAFTAACAESLGLTVSVQRVQPSGEVSIGWSRG